MRFHHQKNIFANVSAFANHTAKFVVKECHRHVRHATDLVMAVSDRHEKDIFNDKFTRINSTLPL